LGRRNSFGRRKWFWTAKVALCVKIVLGAEMILDVEMILGVKIVLGSGNGFRRRKWLCAVEWFWTSKYVEVGFLGRAGRFGQQFLRFLLSDFRIPAQKANKALLWTNKFTVNVNSVG